MTNGSFDLAQDFASGLPLRSRPQYGSTWGARGRQFKSARPDHFSEVFLNLIIRDGRDHMQWTRHTQNRPQRVACRLSIESVLLGVEQ